MPAACHLHDADSCFGCILNGIASRCRHCVWIYDPPRDLSLLYTHTRGSGVVSIERKYHGPLTNNTRKGASDPSVDRSSGGWSWGRPPGPEAAAHLTALFHSGGKSTHG